MTPEQVIKASQQLTAEMPVITGKAQLFAMKELQGQLKYRIFNEGKAQKGSIGKYKSKSYKKVRAKRGLQTDVKDLQFTGTLNKTITYGVTGKDTIILGVLADQRKKTTSAKIADYQEKQTGKIIFKPTDKEMALYMKNVTKITTELISERIKQLFK